MAVSLLSNPPYNMPWKVPELASFLPQYMGYQIPPENNANLAFVLSGLAIMDNKAVFLLPCGVLTSTVKEDKAIRTQLVEENLLAGVILMPDSMFESTSIPTCLLVFDKHKQTRKVEMIDMRQECVKEIRDQRGQFGGASHTGRVYHKEVNVLTEQGMQKALEAMEQFQDIPGVLHSRKSETNQTPGIYSYTKSLYRITGNSGTSSLFCGYCRRLQPHHSAEERNKNQDEQHCCQAYRIRLF